jgi:hypothetical protein
LGLLDILEYGKIRVSKSQAASGSMSKNESATVRQFRNILMDIRNILLEDPDSEDSKRREAQRRLLIATASDEELEQMARLQADMFDLPVVAVLDDLKKIREDHRESVDSWRGRLGKTPE